MQLDYTELGYPGSLDAKVWQRACYRHRPVPTPKTLEIYASR